MLNTIIKYFERTVNDYSNKIAIKEGKSEITFIKLSQLSKRVSSLIASREYINKPVVVFLQKGIAAVSAFIGVLYSGNYYVPVDVTSPSSRITSIIDDLDDCLIISDTKCMSNIPLSVSNNKVINIDEEFLENKIKTNNTNIIDIDPAYIIFTSGSTGKPKGVIISQRGVIDYINWAKETFDISEKENICSQAPFYFDNSTLDIHLMLMYGATLHIVPEIFYSFPVKLLEYINENNINFVFWVPSVLVNIAKMRLLDKIKPTSLNKILFAGEVMPTKHYNYWKNNLPDSLYSNLYGPTEITVDCTYYTIDRVFSNEEVLPIGKQCENTNVILLNKDNKLCESNEKGELCVRGTSLALGYWKDKEKTNFVFQQNPLNNHYNDLIYRTGDFAYYNENDEIIFVGRKDNQIKHMGYRIELGEIENAIMTNGDFQNVCVVYNQNEKKILAFYEAEMEIELKEINKKLLKIIPRYMIPNKFNKLEAFPINSNGKIDRKKIEKLMEIKNED